MEAPIIALPDFPAVIDSTMRSSLVACPRQFYFSHLLGLRKAASSVHLHFGGAIAHGLEVTRKAFWADRLDEVHAVAAGLTALIQFWGDFELTDEMLRSRAGVKSLDAAMDALYSYFEQFPLNDDQISPVMIDDEPLIEKSFALPIPGTAHPVTGAPVLYAGRCDMIGRHGDAVFIVDEKTTTSLGATWRSNWPLRGQLTGYCWGGRSYGLDVAGVIVRGIGVLQGSIRFEQAVLTRPQWLVDQWLGQLSRDVNRAITAWTLARDHHADAPHLAFDQAFDAQCSSYGGCGFVPLCESPDPTRWYSDYTISHWNPLLRSGDVP